MTRINFLTLLLFNVIAISCVQNNSSSEKKMDKKDVNRTKESFSHIVFFDLQDSLDNSDVEYFLNELNKLKEIEQLHSFSAGPFEDMNDARALSDYDICMQMVFRNREDYNIYQEHPVHISMKSNVGSFLKTPPKTYDFRLN